MSKILLIIKRIFNQKTFYLAIPWVSLFASLSFLWLGYSIDFKDKKIETIFKTLGNTLLTGGLFSFLVKSMQYADLYKDQLINIIYNTEHLSRRKDLPEIWERVSNVLFDNKFPLISQLVINDVRNKYLLKDDILYYDTYEQIIEIELIDQLTETIRVVQQSNYIIYPTKHGLSVPLTTSNTISYRKNSKRVVFELNSFNINDVTQHIVVHESIDEINNQHKHSFSFKLETLGENRIAHTITKVYSLKDDCVIGTMKDAIINNFSLMITLKGNLTVDFYEAGTLKPFTRRGINHENVRFYNYNGILYPKQGYFLFVKIKNN